MSSGADRPILVSGSFRTIEYAIRADGSIVACFRCNKNVLETSRISIGLYEVDFTPVSGNISGRPRLATPDVHDATAVPSARTIDLADRDGDPSSVAVFTQDTENNLIDTPFVLMIF